jgi:hypothetical protein
MAAAAAAVQMPTQQVLEVLVVVALIGREVRAPVELEILHRQHRHRVITAVMALV